MASDHPLPATRASTKYFSMPIPLSDLTDVSYDPVLLADGIEP